LLLSKNDPTFFEFASNAHLFTDDIDELLIVFISPYFLELYSLLDIPNLSL